MHPLSAAAMVGCAKREKCYDRPCRRTPCMLVGVVPSGFFIYSTDYLWAIFNERSPVVVVSLPMLLWVSAVHLVCDLHWLVITTKTGPPQFG